MPLFEFGHTLAGQTEDNRFATLSGHAASIRGQIEHGLVMATIGQTRKERDLFQFHDNNAFAIDVRENFLENPTRYQDIRMVNLGLMNPDEAKRKELMIGKNICGMVKKKTASPAVQSVRS